MEKTNSSNADNLSKQKQNCSNVHYHVLHNRCQVICISKNKKILLLGVMNDLIIMNFIQCNGQFKILNKLRQHISKINCIEIINSDLEIITAGDDGFINVWRKKQQWRFIKCLKSYPLLFDRIIVNKSENLMITKGEPCLNFWSKQNDWQFKQQIYPFGAGNFQHLLLNDKSDTLIAANRSICIIQPKSNNFWQITKNFNVLEGKYNFLLCFIKNDLFAIFPFWTGDIIFYQQNQNKLFNQIKQITIQSQFTINALFIPQYSINKEHLIIKMDKFIIFLQLNDNYDIIQYYQIENDTLNCKELIIEDMFILINYYYMDQNQKRILKFSNYKKFINQNE